MQDPKDSGSGGAGCLVRLHCVRPRISGVYLYFHHFPPVHRDYPGLEGFQRAEHVKWVSKPSRTEASGFLHSTGSRRLRLVTVRRLLPLRNTKRVQR